MNERERRGVGSNATLHHQTLTVPPPPALSLITRSFNGNTVVTSLPTDNRPQPKEALPAVSTLTLPY
jgi:hypothetical protein